MNVFFRSPLRSFGLPKEAERLTQKFTQGERLTTDERGQVGALLEQLNRGQVHPAIRALLNGNLVFEPKLDNAALLPFHRIVVPNSIEVIAHPHGHASARVGPTWIDFRSIAPENRGKRMEREARAIKTATRAEAIVSMHSHGHNPNFAVGLLYTAPRSVIRDLRRELLAIPTPVVWSEEAHAGTENCLSILTATMQRVAPELGVTRATNTHFLGDQLANNPNVGMLTVYSNAKESVLASGDSEVLKNLRRMLA